MSTRFAVTMCLALVALVSGCNRQPSDQSSSAATAVPSDQTSAPQDQAGSAPGSQPSP